MSKDRISTALLSASAVAIAKERHLPYSEEQASGFWGLALHRHQTPVAETWGCHEVPDHVAEQLASRYHGHERSGQVIEHAGRQYFAVFHHTADHCAFLSEHSQRPEPYLSLVLVGDLKLPDRQL